MEDQFEYDVYELTSKISFIHFALWTKEQLCSLLCNSICPSLEVSRSDDWRVTANTLNMRDAVIKILHFFQRSLREFEEVKYTTGTRMIPQYYEECLNRLQILSDQQGIKVFSELSSQSNNWWRSVRDELKNLRK